MATKDKYTGYIKLIDRALESYLPRADREPRRLHRAMRYGVFSGGKRIRPVITLEAAIACGGRAKDALPAACAVELVHTYSLIHDDLPSMDDDDHRRGRPSCHRAFDEATAILAGDALLTLAFDVIASGMDALPAARAVKALSAAIGAGGMVGGQAIEMGMRGRVKGAAVLDRVNDLKTAKLFEASAELGAISAGAGPAATKVVTGYARRLGMAFQVVDDILDRDGYHLIHGGRRSRLSARRAVDAAKRSLGSPARYARLCDIADRVLARIS